MQLPAWKDSSARISISETSLLVRSPYYPQWRSEVEKVFARIDAGVEAAKGRKRRRSVVVCLLPAGLPLPAGNPWPRLAQAGRTLALRTAFGDGAEKFLLALARPHGLLPRTRRNAPGSSKRGTLSAGTWRRGRMA